MALEDVRRLLPRPADVEHMRAAARDMERLGIPRLAREAKLLAESQARLHKREIVPSASEQVLEGLTAVRRELRAGWRLKLVLGLVGLLAVLIRPLADRLA